MSRLRNDSGFTLIELLITTMIMTIIFGAVMTALDTFQRQSRLNNDRGDNQDIARRTLDRVSDGVRSAVGSGATALERATASDLVFRTVDPGLPPTSTNSSRQMFRRYCVDANGVLYEQAKYWGASVPAIPSSTCPGTGWDSSRQIAANITTASGAIFSYLPDATNPTQVGIDLSVDTKPTQPPAATTLRSGVSLRNLPHQPTVGITCQAIFGGQVYCDSGGSADPDGGSLTWAWSYGATCATTGSTVATTPEVSQLGLTAGSSYCFKLVATNPAGVSNFDTEVVTAK